MNGIRAYGISADRLPANGLTGNDLSTKDLKANYHTANFPTIRTVQSAYSLLTLQSNAISTSLGSIQP